VTWLAAGHPPFAALAWRRVVPKPPDQHLRQRARARGCSRCHDLHNARAAKHGPGKELPAGSTSSPTCGVPWGFPGKYLHSVFPEELPVPVPDPALCPRHPAEVGHHHQLILAPSKANGKLPVPSTQGPSQALPAVGASMCSSRKVSPLFM